MRFLEFGPADCARVLLVHGAQVPWQIWLPQIERFQLSFRVIVPVLPGHDSQDPSDFTTIEAAAIDIERAYVERFGTELALLCGQSSAARWLPSSGPAASCAWTGSSWRVRRSSGSRASCRR